MKKFYSEALVYIVDDDEAVRDSIKELVNSVSIKANVFSNAQAVLDVLTPDSAGCIVVDIRMAGMSGLSLQKRLIELDINLPLIFISGHGDIDMAVNAIKLGAIDFIQKPYHQQNLLDCINNAMIRDAERKLQSKNHREFDRNTAELTLREQEVMELLLKGLANKLIAKSLNISHRTVEVHRQHIFEKFDVHSASQLIYLVNLRTPQTVLSAY